jgi:hypothetical protein
MHMGRLDSQAGTAWPEAQPMSAARPWPYRETSKPSPSPWTPVVFAGAALEGHWEQRLGRRWRKGGRKTINHNRAKGATQ